MRQCQAVVAQHTVAHEQEVEIEGPWAFRLSLRAIAAELAFDRKQLIEQFDWLQLCLEGNRCVKESGLLGTAYRLSFVKRRLCRHRAEQTETLNRSDQCRLGATSYRRKIGS